VHSNAADGAQNDPRAINKAPDLGAAVRSNNVADRPNDREVFARKSRKYQCYPLHREASHVALPNPDYSAS
jgi:hypothetical protein